MFEMVFGFLPDVLVAIPFEVGQVSTKEKKVLKGKYIGTMSQSLLK